jgi:hypothetical protein
MRKRAAFSDVVLEALKVGVQGTPKVLSFTVSDAGILVKVEAEVLLPPTEAATIDAIGQMSEPEAGKLLALRPELVKALPPQLNAVIGFMPKPARAKEIKSAVKTGLSKYPTSTLIALCEGMSLTVDLTDGQRSEIADFFDNSTILPEWVRKVEGASPNLMTGDATAMGGFEIKNGVIQGELSTLIEWSSDQELIIKEDIQEALIDVDQSLFPDERSLAKFEGSAPYKYWNFWVIDDAVVRKGSRGVYRVVWSDSKKETAKKKASLSSMSRKFIEAIVKELAEK